MDRRSFLRHVAAGASFAAATPLLGEAFAISADANGLLVGGAPSGSVQGMASSTLDASALTAGFSVPPESAAPWVYWVWLGVDTTADAMTYDLNQMKAKGIAGFILYGSQAGSLPSEIPKRILVEENDQFRYEYVKNGDYNNFYTTPIPFSPLQAWTPQWNIRMRHVARECRRLDLKFCLALGLAGTSARIPAEYGNQELIWTETQVAGPGEFRGILPATKAEDQLSDFRRDVAVLAVPDVRGFAASQVINLTHEVDEAGHLIWSPPVGNWKILRFSQVATGARNEWGIFSDAMNPVALDKLWEITMAPLLKEMSADERKGIMGIEDDSWEGGEFTWTERFPEEFRKRRGYDLIPYLPVLTGCLADRVDADDTSNPYPRHGAGSQMGDETIRAQVQRDYELTISDLMADYHYGHLNELCKENGLIFFSEAAGPNLYQADLLKTSSQVEMPMAEFWMPCFHRPAPQDRFLARNAACASHVYGRPISMDEAFTSLGPQWEESPFDMKPVADQAFCDGVNRICVHNMSHSPSLSAAPGYVYVAGTHYGPHITWWEQLPAFNRYLARCSHMLQQGKFVADVMFYEGDNIGSGDSMKVIYPTLGDGYDYDLCNNDVLINRTEVKDGRIVLPDGMSYAVLVLPQDRVMRLEALRKIVSLVEAGATAVGPAPIGLAGLQVSDHDSLEFGALVEKLWGKNHDQTQMIKRPVGAGHLLAGQPARKVLLTMGIPADFEQTGLSGPGEVHWIHRRFGDVDIYFVTSHWQPEETLECTFRISGRQPELWDPVTGTMRDASAFRQEGGRTVIPLKFGPCGSTFVVFRKPIGKGVFGKATTNYSQDRIEFTLSGPWEVSFDPKWGGPEKVMFDTLVDWTKRPEAGIKYYSGTAVYRNQFDMGDSFANSGRLVLDLGELHEVGSVRLNGTELGVVWAKPSRVDITDTLNHGSNVLEITVVNLWPNRLIGDADLAEVSRFTETNIHKFDSHSPLLPSGLVGPVRVISVD